MPESSDHAAVIAPPPLIFAGGLALGLLCNALKPRGWLPRGVARPLGWLLIALGPLPAVLATREMQRAQTPINPYTPVSAIVTSGPYRFSRNPIYLAMTLLYIGIAAVRNALWPMLLLPAVLFVIRRGVIDREERYLARTFGEEYTRYKASVRRWV